MKRSAEVRDFLMSRRARVKPADVGMSSHDPRRRVSGLRREEVASLAGVSIDYYVRLERGDLTGVSESVLEAVGRALQLSPDERRHLFNLARLANSPRRGHWMQPSNNVRPSVQQLLNSMAGPAWVRNDRLDFLATNQLGAALFAPIFEGALSAPNKARFVFLDPRARDFYPDWSGVAQSNVAVLRAAVGRNPYDKRLSDLIGELSTLSDEFSSLWADHDVLTYQTGATRIAHPVVGTVELIWEAMELVGDNGLTLIACVTEPGSESAERLQMLGAWTAPQIGETHIAATVDPHHDAR